MISDYAVILTIIIFVGFDHIFNLATPKLVVPTELKPTRSDLRGWWIPLFDAASPWFAPFYPSALFLLLSMLPPSDPVAQVCVHPGGHPRPPPHRAALHGPADHLRHRQQEGAQAQGGCPEAQL